MADFSKGAGKSDNGNLIPRGQLAWAVISFRGTKISQNDGRYLDLELTIDDNQPFARKKVWDMIGDPEFGGNSEAYRDMGLRAITRILEAARGAGPANLAGYQLPGDAPACYQALDGLRVPIKIGIQPGKDGYDDKNKVAEYLTPNPQSSGNKGYVKLMAGQFNMTPGAAQPAVQGAFSTAAPAAFAGAAASAFTAPAQASATPVAQAAPAASAATTTATPPASAAPPANSWLAQAQPAPPPPA